MLSPFFKHSPELQSVGVELFKVSEVRETTQVLRKGIATCVNLHYLNAFLVESYFGLNFINHFLPEFQLIQGLSALLDFASVLDIVFNVLLLKCLDLVSEGLATLLHLEFHLWPYLIYGFFTLLHQLWELLNQAFNILDQVLDVP